jgi:hypothetical protein
MTFNKWLDTFVSEKELDTEKVFEVEGQSGPNFIPCGVVIEHIKIAPAREQQAIKQMIVKIDFCNGDVMHFFNHLAQAIAI